jgi:hypothetical protein
MERMQYILTGPGLDDFGARLFPSINFVSKVSWRKDNTELLKLYRKFFPEIMKAESSNADEYVLLVTV